MSLELQIYKALRGNHTQWHIHTTEHNRNKKENPTQLHNQYLKWPNHLKHCKDTQTKHYVVTPYPNDCTKPTISRPTEVRRERICMMTPSRSGLRHDTNIICPFEDMNAACAAWSDRVKGGWSWKHPHQTELRWWMSAAAEEPGRTFRDTQIPSTL